MTSGVPDLANLCRFGAPSHSPHAEDVCLLPGALRCGLSSLVETTHVRSRWSGNKLTAWTGERDSSFVRMADEGGRALRTILAGGHDDEAIRLWRAASHTFPSLLLPREDAARDRDHVPVTDFWWSEGIRELAWALDKRAAQSGPRRASDVPAVRGDHPDR